MEYKNKKQCRGKWKLPDPPPKNFYVYEWFNTENGHVFYVGKGIGDRAIRLSKTHRNEYFLRYFNKYDCDFRIVKDNLTEKEAYRLENTIYQERRKNNECECNLADTSSENGGPSLKGDLNGMYNKTHSYEVRKKLSEINTEYNKNHLNSNSRHTIAYNKETKEYFEFDTKKQCMEWLITISPFFGYSDMTCYRIIGYSDLKHYSYSNWCFKVCKVHEIFNKDDTVSSFESDYVEVRKTTYTSTHTYEEDVTTKERAKSFYFRNQVR